MVFGLNFGEKIIQSFLKIPRGFLGHPVYILQIEMLKIVFFSYKNFKLCEVFIFD